MARKEKMYQAVQLCIGRHVRASKPVLLLDVAQSAPVLAYERALRIAWRASSKVNSIPWLPVNSQAGLPCSFPREDVRERGFRCVVAEKRLDAELRAGPY